MRKWEPVPRHPNIYSYETKKGTRFGVRRGFTNNVGKRDEYTKSGFKNWRDADYVLKQFESALVSNQINPISSRSVTFDQYFQSMIKRNTDLKVWRDSTVQIKLNYYNKHIKQRFGHKRISEISRKEYQDFINQKILEGLAQTTMQTLNSVVQIVMNDAEKNDVIDKNRLRGILINGAKPAKSVEITPEDYATFMAAAKKILSKYEMTMLYLLTLGERRSELAGLQFRSFEKITENGIDYYKITYLVGRTDKSLTGSKLKTESSYRSNYVSGEIVEYIDYALQYAKNIMTKTGRVINPQSFIYINEKTGMPIYPANINRKLFGPVVKATGIELRPHMLRHYFATKALEDGLPGMSVMHWLGHKNMDMTNAYTRPTEAGALRVINGMQDTLFDPQNSN